MKMRIFDCNPVCGFVDYGSIDTLSKKKWVTKMRCKKCGNAWLSENHLNGHNECPKCHAIGKCYIISVR